MNKDDYKELALKWAPINYQFIKLTDKIETDGREDVPLEIKRDLLVPINLDGFTNVCECGFMEHEHKQYVKTDENQFSSSPSEKCDCSDFIPKHKNLEDAWDTSDRRNVLEANFVQNLLPVAYYSIATTNNHFYILYSFYHADDKKHPNDMEGCMVIIERDVNGDKLIGMLTVAHLFFPRYVYDTNKIKLKTTIIEKVLKNLKKNKSVQQDIGKQSLSKRIKNIEQRLKVLSLRGKMEAEDEQGPVRALIQQETQGHGLYALGGSIAWPYSWERKIWQIINKIDIIQYYPSEVATPYEINDIYRYKGMPHLTSVYYQLVDIHETNKKNGLYNWIESKKVFTEKGNFHGDDAKPPWKWVEKNGGKEYTLWEHPAELTDLYFELVKGKPFIVKYKKTMSDICDLGEN